MKRCPECRRDYYDESLLYCLDDGSALLDGPASGGALSHNFDGPQTAILHSPPAEAATRPQILVTHQTEVPPSGKLASNDAPDAQANSRKYLPAIALAISVIIVAGVGFGLYKYGNRSTTISFESAKFTRLTNSGKIDTNATGISPDGKWLAYVTSDGDQSSLWMQQVGIANSGTQIVAPASVEYWGLAFSPNGDYVYYSVGKSDEQTGSVYQVPVLGGAARKLLSGISTGKVSFSPDAKQFAYYGVEGDEDRLMIANADGSSPRSLLARRGNEFLTQAFQGPSWSPDGKTILTTVGTYDPRSMSVAAVSVETGEMTFFSSHKFTLTGDAAWLSDGSGLLLLADEFTANARPVPQRIWQISYPSGEAQRISNDLTNYSAFSLTANSNVLAVVQETGMSNIWTAPTGDMAVAGQVTTGSDQNSSPSWTPDGKIVYVNKSGTSSDLYIVDPLVKGASPTRLTINAGSNFSPAVSPDGQFIVFTSNRTGVANVWKIDIDGSNPKQLTENGSNHDPSFSPDGREVIYMTYASKGTIWKVGIEGGEPVQLTDKESNAPRFSPDGKQIVCGYQEVAKDPYKMAVLSSAGGPPTKIFARPAGFTSSLGWTADSRSIAYTVTKAGVTNIWAQPVDGGAPKQITNSANGHMGSTDLSLDGKQIAFSRGTSTSDVVLISGFKK